MSNDFFKTSEGEDLAGQTGEYDTGGGDFDPIPAKTQVLAAPDEAKWDNYNGDDYISVRWVVFKPEQYRNRKIFQKIRVNERDTKKADKAKRMLAAIDKNAGSNLLKLEGAPTDSDLARALVNKLMILMLQVWTLKDEDTGEIKKGNWISAVSPRDAAKPSAPKPAPKKDQDFDDDIPF